ncbi:MAG: hypothetical protein IIA45_16110, partial [Bacteroidetes bacterium]|nr:hypothetical protein [Bacteroidota bacterium]
VQASMAADRNVLRSTKPIDSPARYSEDISELHKFLLDNLNKVSEPKTYHSFGYRETYIQNITSKSTIYISFVVLSNGNIQNPKVIIGGHAVHQRNILDSIRFASRWIPAQSGGKNVDSLVIIELNTRRQSP